MESAQAFMARVGKMDVGVCPCCRQGRLRVIAVLAGLGRLQAFGAIVRVVASTRAQHNMACRPGGIWRGDLATGAGC